MPSRKKTIVVTGASSGIGLDVCRFFAGAGWRVIGLSRNTTNAKVSGVEFFDVDIRNPFNLQRVGIKRIDVLVNNAGVFGIKRIGDSRRMYVESIIDTNLTGTICSTIECLKYMKSGGRIINIGSVAGTHGIEYQAVYCASKYGVNGFFESLQHELHPKGILLTTINPGGVDTKLWDPPLTYPGIRKDILRPRDITNMVNYVVGLPKNVVIKSVVMYPKNEIH